MILEIAKEKAKVNKMDEINKQNKSRLQRRLQQVKMKEKREIPGDGNCQFASISDQLFDNIDHAKELREQAVDWMRKHKDWKLPENNAKLSDFSCDMEWDEFCDHMAKSGIWGNHLTLLALAEVRTNPSSKKRKLFFLTFFLAAKQNDDLDYIQCGK